MSANGLIAAHGVQVTISRMTHTAGSSGEVLRSWSPVSVVRAFVQPSSASRDVLHGAQRNLVSYRVFLSPGVDVRMEDRIEYGTGPDRRILRVTGVTIPGEKSSGTLARIEVECYEELPRG